ncbi:hypothetical protein ACFLQY_00700 [Verrucomicrobiota bacterium]
MGVRRKFRKKPVRRPIKCAREKARRVRTQKARLVKLGMDAAAVERLNNMEIRQLLRHPAKLSA